MITKDNPRTKARPLPAGETSKIMSEEKEREADGGDNSRKLGPRDFEFKVSAHNSGKQEQRSERGEPHASAQSQWFDRNHVAFEARFFCSCLPELWALTLNSKSRGQAYRELSPPSASRSFSSDIILLVSPAGKWSRFCSRIVLGNHRDPFFRPLTIVFGVLGVLLMLASMLWAMIDRYPEQPFFPTGEMLAVPLRTSSSRS